MDSSTRLLRVGLVVGAVVLATLTYFLVERPIRFGCKKGNATAIALGCALLLTAVGALTINRLGGLTNRQYIKEYASINEQLKIPIYKDKAGLSYTDNKEIWYNRYFNANAIETIAIIGDSHAQSAFHGISQLGFTQKKFNTVLLGRIVPGNAIIRPDYQTERLHIFKILSKKDDIKKVFIITRGQVYINMINKISKKQIGEKIFFEDLQSIIKNLLEMKKKVYLVTEDPYFSDNPQKYVARPFRKANLYTNFPRPTKTSVFNQQKIYRDILSNIKGATVIDTIDYWCPRGECFAFTNDGLPTRYDGDHLSFLGSEMLANDLLKPYLLERVQ